MTVDDEFVRLFRYKLSTEIRLQLRVDEEETFIEVADIGPTGEQEDSDMKLLLRSDLMHDEYLRNELVKEHRSRVVYHYWQMDCESTPSTHEALDMFLCNFTTRGDEIGCLEIEYDWETDFSQQEEPNADDKHTNNSIERDARKLSGIFTVLRCFGITTTVKLPGTPINRHPILERIRQLRVEVARDDGHSHFWLKPGWLATRELDKIVNDEELKRAFYNAFKYESVSRANYKSKRTAVIEVDFSEFRCSCKRCQHHGN